MFLVVALFLAARSRSLVWRRLADAWVRDRDPD
jgi:hypothetical protein